LLASTESVDVKSLASKPGLEGYVRHRQGVHQSGPQTTRGTL
jgi:hypothetical protein